ncbi:MAG: hypothetical protein AAGH76_14745 [Pseudomonadota bacterium]
MRVPFIASAAAISVFVVGIQSFGDSGDGPIVSFESEYPTPTDCVGGAAARIERCDSKPCFSGVSLFVRRCLNDIATDSEPFCHELRADASAGIVAAVCDEQGLEAMHCTRVIDYSRGYCEH